MGEKKTESMHELAILVNKYALTRRKGKIRPSYSDVSGGQNTNRGMNDITPGRNV